jgi:hypothetical protein
LAVGIFQVKFGCGLTLMLGLNRGMDRARPKAGFRDV